ncbi:MAG: hypothetical protein HND58_17445 [Planctomycetota bacterium]|nr:MAG: hypothetical protein HND58_17445 [Planctomycetota bacterium]
MTKGQLAGGNGQDQAWLHEKLLLVADLVGSDPKTILCDKEPAGEPGLACEAINERARRAGLIGSDQFIIEPHEEPSGDAGVQRPSRWIRFHHPDSGRPVIDLMVRDSYSVANPQVAGHGERIATYLRAWAEYSQTAEPRVGPTDSSSDDALAEFHAHTLPSPIADFARRLHELVPYARKLLTNMIVLERAEADGLLAEVVRRGIFPYQGRALSQEEADRIHEQHEDEHADAAIHAVICTRHLLNATPHLLERLPVAAGPIDDSLPTRKKVAAWSSRVDAGLRELVEAVFLGQPAGDSRSTLPWPDQGVAAAVEKSIGCLESCLLELLQIPRTRAPAVEINPGLKGTVCGELLPAEAAALLCLGERDWWGVDELPVNVDVSILRRLDSLEYVLVSKTNLSQPRRVDGMLLPRTPSRDTWLSPIHRSGMVVSWDQILARTRLDANHHPSEIRVSELGLAQIGRLERLLVVADDTPDEPIPDTEHWAVLEYAESIRGRPNREQIVSALDATHRRGVVHQAIKDLHGWRWVHAPPQSRKGVAVLEAGRIALAELRKRESRDKPPTAR